MADLAVDVAGLCRTFPAAAKGAPPRVALDDVSLGVRRGEVHGLLGPNGAGKTTLCKIIGTVLTPSAGSVRVDGFDVVTQTREVRTRIGIVFGGERGLYTRLTARQNLTYWAALYRVPRRVVHARVDALLTRVGLTDRADQRVETFSRGMKQRLHLARGLVAEQRLLILDEPTTGMDPVAAHDFRSLVAELRAEGRTLLLTTHDMAEAEAVCDRVTMIDAGRLLGTQDPRTIGSWISAYERVDARPVPPVLAARLGRLHGVGQVEPLAGDAVRVHTCAPGATEGVLRALVAAGVTDVATGRPSLEEVYLRVMAGRGLVV